MLLLPKHASVPVHLVLVYSTSSLLSFTYIDSLLYTNVFHPLPFSLNAIIYFIICFYFKYIKRLKKIAFSAIFSEFYIN